MIILLIISIVLNLVSLFLIFGTKINVENIQENSQNMWYEMKYQNQRLNDLHGKYYKDD
jgi:hypothetical protein